MTVRDELERLRKKGGGVLMPSDVVEAARPKHSPLHGSFTWDDGEAAEKYRLWQARQLISVHVVLIGKKKQSTRMYVSLSTDREDGGGYRFITDVLGNAEARQTLLMDARKDMIRFREKYETLAELKDVLSAMRRHLNGKSNGRKAGVVAHR